VRQIGASSPDFIWVTRLSADTNDLRCGERGKCLHEGRPALLLDSFTGESISKCWIRRDIAYHPNDVGVAKKDEASVAIVIGERPERLGSQGDLRVHLARRLEREGHNG
jgi:hypothetical protein